MVKRIAGILDSVVGCACVRGERPSATRAPVSSSLSGLGLEEAVRDDVALPGLAVVFAVQIGADSILDTTDH